MIEGAIDRLASVLPIKGSLRLRARIIADKTGKDRRQSALPASSAFY